MIKSTLRGHEIEYKNNEWLYCDNQESTIETHKDRICGNCHKMATEEGHDVCIKNLKGVMNACCGHGVKNDTYIQFLDGLTIHGEDAIIIQNILKKYR